MPLGAVPEGVGAAWAAVANGVVGGRMEAAGVWNCWGTVGRGGKDPEGIGKLLPGGSKRSACGGPTGAAAGLRVGMGVALDGVAEGVGAGCWPALAKGVAGGLIKAAGV